MDRQLEKKSKSLRYFLIAGVLIAGISLLTYNFLKEAKTSSLRVDANRITVSTVENGEFEEYYPFDGKVEPTVSVYLDVEEGGRVDEILVEGGQAVNKGDLIMRISNAALQRSSIDTETRLLENLDRLSNTQFDRAQSQLALREQALNMDYQIRELEKKHQRLENLIENASISLEEFEKNKDELSYLKERRELLKERVRQEDLLSQQQLKQTESSIERLSLSLGLLSTIVDSLDVKAPISGHLSSIDAALGQSIARGQRIGQIDKLDEFKLRVEVDQYYISSINIDTIGHLKFEQKEIKVGVKKIYPEVVNNAFAIDMNFIDGEPQGLRRGQTLTVELSFSEPEQSLMVKKGGFYQQTGGRWVYLVSDDGNSASRVNIRLGRQNPRYVEVLEGLRPGDRIITSGYEVYKEVDEILFDTAM